MFAPCYQKWLGEHKEPWMTATDIGVLHLSEGQPRRVPCLFVYDPAKGSCLMPSCLEARSRLEYNLFVIHED